MSINNSLYIGVSGMRAHGDAISVVGDNIANASTIGYKRSRASFSDLLGGEMGSNRLGGGVFLGGTQTMYNQGSIQQTGNPLDMALSGGGMFVVKGNHGGRDGQYYSRDGRFQMDDSGYVVNQGGMRLQGYSIGADGVRGTGIGDLQLGGRTSEAIASTTAKLQMNLSSDVVADPTIPYDPTNKDSYQYSTSMTVRDSLGAEHKVDMYFRNNGSGGWEWHAYADGGDVTGGTAGTPVEIGTGGLTFDTNGALTAQTGALTANFTNATAGQAIAMDFGLGGDQPTTQLSGNTAINVLDVDGRGAGNLQDLVVNADGSIEGVYDNGDRIKIAQVAIADFASNEGLDRQGDGLFMATAESGQALIDAAGTGARGSIVAGALEASNVDLGEELVTLIAYQRAFQANSKTVTTADEMMSDVNNLKR
jgi:flagellar hook protein FlgE